MAAETGLLFGANGQPGFELRDTLAPSLKLLDWQFGVDNVLSAVIYQLNIKAEQ